jgi:hypothetical protein
MCTSPGTDVSQTVAIASSCMASRYLYIWCSKTFSPQHMRTSRRAERDQAFPSWRFHVDGSDAISQIRFLRCCRLERGCKRCVRVAKFRLFFARLEKVAASGCCTVHADLRNRKETFNLDPSTTYLNPEKFTRQLERITLHLVSVSDSATTAGDSEFFPSIESSAGSRQTGSRQTGSRQTGSRQTGSRQTGSRQTGLTVHRPLDRQKGTVRAQTILLRSHPSRQLVSAAPQIRSEARHPSDAVRMWRAQPVMELRRSSFPEASVTIYPIVNAQQSAQLQ